MLGQSVHIERKPGIRVSREDKLLAEVGICWGSNGRMSALPRAACHVPSGSLSPPLFCRTWEGNSCRKQDAEISHLFSRYRIWEPLRACVPQMIEDMGITRSLLTSWALLLIINNPHYLAAPCHTLTLRELVT